MNIMQRISKLLSNWEQLLSCYAIYEMASSDIYQYILISSLSSYHLASNTAYAIVMMTSTGAQDVGWAESNTEATGDMGEFDNVNTGGNNGGAYGQMEIAVVPEPATLGLVGLGAALLLLVRRRALLPTTVAHPPVRMKPLRRGEGPAPI